MTFDSIKNGLVDLLGQLGYAESTKAFDFKGVGAGEYENTFILIPRSGSLDPSGKSETLVDRVYDKQEWEVHIAYAISESNDIEARDQISRKREDIVKKIDNSNNWKSFVRHLKYKAWEIEDRESYVLLKIKFTIIDNVVFT